MDIPNSTSDIPLKQCSRKENCINPLGSLLPATSEYFYSNKKKKDGLSGNCKACQSAANKRWKTENADYYREYCRERDRGRERGGGDEYQAHYRAAHREKARETSRKWRNVNPEWEKSNGRRWRKNNPDRVRILGHRRLARKRNLPHAMTDEQWQRAVEYFGYSCAVCGRPRGLWHTLAMDHWTPLTSPDCPGTVVSNCLPLCHGEAGCNNSKSNRDPAEWLNRKFGKRKAAQVLKRINAYFEWVKEQDGEG